MTDIVALVEQILRLGFPAVVLIEVWIIWKAYQDLVKEYITASRKSDDCAKDRDLGEPK